MAPGACGEPSSCGITGVPATIINYHPVSPWTSWHRCAALCLGESPAQARLKCLDLHCSFEALVTAEYGGHDHLDFTARNYVENVRKEETGISGITYEGPPEPGGGHVWALRGLVPMSLLYGRSLNCACVQLPGSGCQAGSLPPGCPEETTWRGVVGLDPHPGDSGRGQSA